MDEFVIGARVVLAAIFALSGTAKLVDRVGTRLAVDAFGVPRRIGGFVATSLPFVELAIVVLLIPGSTARVAAFAAVALLIAFSIGIAVNLTQGRRPSCNCFGSIHTEPLRPMMLLRNAVFGALAVIVAFGTGHHAGGIAAGVATGVVAVLGAAGAVIARRRAITRSDDDFDATLRPALVPGDDAPAFTLTSSSGGTTSLSDLLARGRDVLVVFVSMGCKPCKDLAPELARWQREFPDRVTIAVMSHGVPPSNGSESDTKGFGELLIDAGPVARAYGTWSTPSAVLIDREGKVAAPTATGSHEIAGLLLQAFGWNEVVAALEERFEHEDAHAHDDHEVPAGGDDDIDAEAIDARFVPRGRETVAMAARDGESILVDSSTGMVHLLNPTAAIVWSCLNGSGTIEEIALDVAEVFGRSADEVVPAVFDVIKGFGREGLLVGVSSHAPSEAPSS